MCVRIKRSFCYETLTTELAEVCVRPAYRKRGIAGAMIAFAERLCRERDAVRTFELLTGRDNLIAQSVCRRLGCGEDGEIRLSKG